MTKYILVGGYPDKAPDKGKAFCEELIKGFEEPVKILDCMFARPKESWAKSFADDKEFFKKLLPEKNWKSSLPTPKNLPNRLSGRTLFILGAGEPRRSWNF